MNRKLMTDSFSFQKFFYVDVLEFDAIVTSYFLDLGFKLILSSFCKLLKCILYFTLMLM
jgi:hypothetical protein